MPIITTDRLLDINAFGRNELADLVQTGQLVSATPTRVEIRAYVDGYEFQVILTGTGLGGLTSTGFPTTGVITGFRLVQGDLVLGIEALSIQASELNATLTATDSSALWNLLYGGNDTITGGNTIGYGNTLFGYGGNDTLNGGTGADLLNGGAGNDIVYGGDETDPSGATYGDGIDGADGDDTLYGGAGRDVILGGEGVDLIDGGDGNDILYHDGDGLDVTVTFLPPENQFGSPIPARVFLAQDRRAEDGAADTINGGAGNDFIYLGVGDSADGGIGTDTVEVNFRGRTTALNLNMSADAAAALGAASGGTYTNVERYDVVGSLFNDTITGGNDASILYGEAGEDQIDGGGGNDNVAGGAFTNSSRIGNAWGSRFDDGQRDSLFGGESNDLVNVGLLDVADGGNGTDQLSITLDGLTQGVSLDLTTGDRFATLAAVTGGTYVNFETVSSLHTTEHDDVIRSLGVATIYTFNGNDAVYADDSTNTIGLGDGDDLVYAMGGNDLILGGFGNDRMYGGAGSDTIYADVDYDPTQPVGSGADFLDGGDGNDSLYGGAGDDVIVGGAGGDRILGEAGIDTVSYQGSIAGISIQRSFNGFDPATGEQIYSYFVSGGDAQGDTLTSIERVLGSDANDTISNFQYADGAEGADALEGSAGADILLGGAGDDVLRGMDGADQLDGGDGIDIVSYSRLFSGGVGTPGVTVDLRIQGVAQNTGDGVDTLINIEGVVGSINSDILHGDDQANYIQGAGESIQGGSSPYQGDQLFGHGGDDVIVGDGATTGLGYTPGDGISRGYDLISGGDGNDIITAGNGADIVNGDAGDDTIFGEWDSDTLNGGSGDDVIDGGTLNDHIDGGDGNDRLIGGSGNDTLIGGVGIDTADYASATAAVTVNLTLGVASSDGQGNSDTLSDIENLTGSAFDDQLTGSSGDNAISGGAGSDTVSGADGDDVITGGLGNDTINGGTGTDTAVFSGGLGSYGFSSGPNGSLIVTGADGTDTLTGIERVRFDDGTYVLATGHRYFEGGAGADTVTGTNGRDELQGLGGDDILNGLDGDDYLTGGAGNDTIDGGAGADMAIFSGSITNYTITSVAGGVSVAGANGTDIVNNVERFRFDDGIFILASGYQYVEGSNNAETILGSFRSDEIHALGGDDTINAGDADDTIIGGLGNDTIDGGVGTDLAVFSGGLGSYSFSSGPNGNLIVTGADGSDTLINVERVQFSDGIYVLATGHRYFEGGGGADTVIGTNGRDELRGLDGDDVLNGLDGDDYLIGGAGNDTIDGGAGADMAIFSGSITNYTITSVAGGVSVAGANGTDIVNNVERFRFDDGIFILASGYQYVEGSNNAETILGSFRSDEIHALGGDDTINAGDADDTIIGGLGNDTIDGGTGTDLAVFSGLRSAYTITQSGGQTLVVGADGSDTLINVERLQFSDGIYDITGNPLAAPAFETQPLRADDAKTDSGPQVLPGAVDEVLAKDGDEGPQVLPGAS
ncbi:calcium-binding protein, partial [uncultured Brevundimonas sp.]|uniref:beta strand repeat-containing protein n=1 Tax=uncultured Brevundimonas sp. TaxID=213418 RepID=UPI0025F1014F